MKPVTAARRHFIDLTDRRVFRGSSLVTHLRRDDRRAERRYGRQVVEEGIREARAGLTPAGWGTVLIIALAIWVRQKAAEMAAEQDYYDAMRYGDVSALHRWEDWAYDAEQCVEYA